jgi:pimeloyl-ACP methyl ester carboxylesterase
MPVLHVNETDIHDIAVDEGLHRVVMHGGLATGHTRLHPWLDPLDDDLKHAYYAHRRNRRSGRPTLPTLTLEQLASDTDALRAQPGFGRVAVFAHAAGGFIALPAPSTTLGVSVI